MEHICLPDEAVPAAPGVLAADAHRVARGDRQPRRLLLRGANRLDCALGRARGTMAAYNDGTYRTLAS